jgi:hypothetical protein
MAQAVSIQNEDINSIVGGGAVALLTPSTTNYYNLYSSSATAITGAVTVSASATPAGFVVFNLLLSTSFTFGGAGAFTFFGTSVSEGYMKAGTLFQATYNGSAYTITILPSFSQSGFIQGSDIADTTIPLTKLAALPSAQIIVGNGSNVPTAVTMSGDATLSNTGALSIAAGAIGDTELAVDAVRANKIKDGEIGTAKLDTTLQAYFSQPSVLIPFSVTIPSAEVLTAFTTPVVIVAAVAGKKIKPVGDVYCTMDYLGTAYTTNGGARLYHSGASIAIATTTANGFLFGTVDRDIKMTSTSVTGATDTQYIANADLLWSVLVGNPLAGTADVTISGLYQLVDA